MHKILGKMRKAIGVNKGTVKNRQKLNEPLKLIIGNRMNMNDTPTTKVSSKKNVSFKPRPNAINYAQLLQMNAAKNKTENSKNKTEVDKNKTEKTER